MIQILQMTENGAGLAAPQIGIPLQVICLKESGNEILVMMNPKMTCFYADGVEAGIEGCLSYPGAQAKVQRYKHIGLEFLGLAGNVGSLAACIFTRSYSNFEARVIQHEMDHLEGICHVRNEWRKGRLVAAQMGKLPR